jgi:hypothetical protein
VDALHVAIKPFHGLSVVKNDETPGCIATNRPSGDTVVDQAPRSGKDRLLPAA